MNHAFNLPESLAHKSDSRFIGGDGAHFAAIDAALGHTVATLTARIDALRRAPGGAGHHAMERDMDIHRTHTRLATIERYGLDLCLGRMVGTDGTVTYIGRLGLTDPMGEQLLVDWRTPAAEPFFTATLADPRGLTSRRRYRWSHGSIVDFWDESLTADTPPDLVLDRDSAFLAGLSGGRGEKMRDVLGTIAADQDAIIRAGSAGTLVVDGGPGTGKTVVALHRAAYLLYADPRLSGQRGSVLVVGPHRPYLSYVADVLPGLGEQGVLTCTIADMVPESASAAAESDPEVARLKASAAMVAAIEPAVRFYEESPGTALRIETYWGEATLTPNDWAEAFAEADPAATHNDARDAVWEKLLEIMLESLPGVESGERGRACASLRRNRALTTAFNRAWPLLDPTDIVGDLWSVPAYLARCAPQLNRTEVTLLQRDDPGAWTTSDLPLLDAARRRIGDPENTRRRHRHAAALRAERARMDDVIDDVIDADDSEMQVASMLRSADLRNALDDHTVSPVADPDETAGPFAHIVVDEAQELTDAQWQMLISRCPARSFTVVGDRAQARDGFTESWTARLGRVGLRHIAVAGLSVNYRTPVEIMAEAEPLIRAAVPDANVPRSIRSSGLPVIRAGIDDLDAVLDAWLRENPDGTGCVIGGSGPAHHPRIRTFTPGTAKGLEFDLVVLVRPESFGAGVAGAVDRYVAMTRATQRLVILS
ncbi:AAA family ATPase [Gordonia pseudamarae]|jgi:DNA helicase IV|uniref:AAA family ATPase n=1 Tax=Gordonia pseudamarae TaxID=2831662 RepID=A0ABX6ICM9_9ACTN|nr:RNA polymerase recycling motor ATPase HelR [Gordonia pseudamarae]QHN24747.1 AAA family ATPase [Gordonia pseudamarae]QHN33678.1 AAA family ATPase [Gordonia pseudamarae]